jgi:hypothetical protein
MGGGLVVLHKILDPIWLPQGDGQIMPGCGAAIYMEGGSAEIYNCVFSGNHAVHAHDLIEDVRPPPPQVLARTRPTISHAWQGNNGGAIAIMADTRLVLFASTFSDNVRQPRPSPPPPTTPLAKPRPTTCSRAAGSTGTATTRRTLATRPSRPCSRSTRPPPGAEPCTFWP